MPDKFTRALLVVLVLLVGYLAFSVHELEEQVDRLLETARTTPVAIDLERQIVTTPFQDRFAFAIDPFRKACLLDGLDEVGLTLARGAKIAEYEHRQARDMPWLAHGTEKAA